jgi:hypothetical protein
VVEGPLSEEVAEVQQQQQQQRMHQLLVEEKTVLEVEAQLQVRLHLLLLQRMKGRKLDLGHETGISPISTCPREQKTYAPLLWERF